MTSASAPTQAAEMGVSVLGTCDDHAIDASGQTHPGKTPPDTAWYHSR